MPAKARPWWYWAVRIIAGLAVVALVVWVLRGRMPSLPEIGRALRASDWAWVPLALALQVISVGMLIRQQDRLLHAFGIRIPIRRLVAITYSSTAISMSLPAGGAVGAGWSYRQYRANGATPGTAAAVMLLSGVLSTLALVLLYVAGIGLSAFSRATGLGLHSPWSLAFAAVGCLAVVVALAWLLDRGSRVIPAESHPSDRYLAWAKEHRRLGALLAGVASTGRSARGVRAQDWRWALTASVLNWGLDAACLYVCVVAAGIRVDLVSLGLIYLGIQVVRQIPLTPGGIGVVEASLLAALLAVGAAQGPASAAVILYRLLSAWLIVPVGYSMVWLLRRRAAPARPTAS